MTIMAILCIVFQVDLFSQVNMLIMVFGAVFFFIFYVRMALDRSWPSG